jgi:hypothetical protein
VRVVVQIAIFLILLIGCIIGCTILWQNFVTDMLYNCTDSGGAPDFLLSSRHWVHQPVAVHHVASGRSMSEPDAIRAGWSLTTLELLRWALVGVSIVASWLASDVTWSRKPSKGDA